MKQFEEVSLQMLYSTTHVASLITVTHLTWRLYDAVHLMFIFTHKRVLIVVTSCRDFMSDFQIKGGLRLNSQ